MVILELIHAKNCDFPFPGEGRSVFIRLKTNALSGAYVGES